MVVYVKLFTIFNSLYFQITALKIKHNPFAKAFLDAKERWVNTYKITFMHFLSKSLIVYIVET